MKRLLFIRYRKSDSIDAGGEQCTNSNYRVLCSLFGEENIKVYHINEGPTSKLKAALSGLSVLGNFLRGYYFGLTPKKVEEIVEMSRYYQYIFIDRSIFGIIAKALKEYEYEGKIITFFHNVESAYFDAKIGKLQPWRSVVINCVSKNDQQSCDYSDVTIALNERDKQEIEQRYHHTPNILSPIVFKDIYKLPEYPKGETSKTPICLFLGTYFPMNVRGILWFVKEVMPETNIKLQIVGKGMKAILPMVKDMPNIEVFSDVPDLKPYIENADFMLLPIFEGSGMKVKTCEALMYGKNIIGTTEAFEGYDVNFDKVGACCNTKEEFVNALKEVSNNPRSRFNMYSRNIFVNRYSEEDRKKKFAPIFK